LGGELAVPEEDANLLESKGIEVLDKIADLIAPIDQATGDAVNEANLAGRGHDALKASAGSLLLGLTHGGYDKCSSLIHWNSTPARRVNATWPRHDAKADG
jgi:hypothetical protein